MTYRPLISGKKLLNLLKDNKKSKSKRILEDLQSYSNIKYAHNITDYINKVDFQLEKYGYSGAYISTWKEL